MTTIAWDGRTLATDSRVTTHHAGPDGHGHTLHDDESKILRPEKPVFFEGSKVLAVTYCGSVRSARGAIKILFAGECIKEFYTKAAKVHLAAPSSNGFTLLILTVYGLYSFRFHSGEPEVRHVGDVFAAFGTGTDVASYLMRRFGAPAPVALAGASNTDRHTGGVITYVTLKDDGTLATFKEGEPYGRKYIDSREAADELVRDFVVDPEGRQKLLGQRYKIKPPVEVALETAKAVTPTETTRRRTRRQTK